MLDMYQYLPIVSYIKDIIHTKNVLISPHRSFMYWMSYMIEMYRHLHVVLVCKGYHTC